MLVVLAAALLVALFVFLLTSSSPGRQVIIAVPKGATLSRIAEILAKNKVIKSPLAFRAFAQYQKTGARIMAGEYRLREGMNPQEALEVLQKGPILRVFTVTVPEGLTIDQTARLVAFKTAIGHAEFTELARRKSEFNYSFLQADPSQSLEGYLFPKTYQVLPGAKAKTLINLMLRQFSRETVSLDWKAAETRGVTPFQVVTIASLIEKEARVASERELISAVIYNRLRAGIPLQIDATVQYALPAWKQKLTYQDLSINSPYNTYLYKGLPPGPICSPSLASLRAALNPAQVDYLYYLVTGKDGSHTFTKSYEEFLRLKQQVKRNGG